MYIHIKIHSKNYIEVDPEGYSKNTYLKNLLPSFRGEELRNNEGEQLTISSTYICVEFSTMNVYLCVSVCK